MKKDKLDKLSKEELVELVNEIQQSFAESQQKSLGLIEQLNQKNAELKKAQADKLHAAKLASIGEFSAGLAHEINNPLSILSANIHHFIKDLERSQLITERRSKMSEMCFRAIDRISNISKSLRSLSRKEAEDLNHVFNVQDAVQNTLYLIESNLKSLAIRIAVDIDPELYIQGHEGKFQQVVMNLIANARDALEFTEDKVISIKAFGDMNNVMITVTDNGPGIRSEVKSKIFESFYTSKEDGKGTGLGLSLSKSFVSDLKGVIDVESEPGEGATFIIKIPRIEFKQEQHNPNAHWYGKVLLVNHDPAVRAVLANGLKRQGLQVDTIEDGVKAIQIIQTKTYDIVFSNFEMPNMSGEEFIKIAKELVNEETGFILFSKTRYDDIPKEKQREIDLHADGFLERPYPEEKIVSLINFCKQKKLKTA